MSADLKDGQHITGAQSEGHQILGNNFSAGGDNIININNGVDAGKQCLIALFTTNPTDDRAKYVSFKGNVIGEAFQWVLESPVYQNWLKASTGSQLLWLCGGPGMGKTMLSIYLSKELEKLSDCRVLYYFCESRDPKRNTAVSVLRGLIYALVSQRKTLMRYLLPDYEVQQSALFGPDSIEALWRIFTQMINDPDTGTVYCVIDALDECHADVEHLEHLLKKIRSYFATTELSDRLERASLTSGALKLAIISREFPECVVSEMEGFQRIPLEVTDPQIYIDAKLNELVSPQKYDDHTKDLLRQDLKRRGDGTLLWIDMAIARLRKSSSAEDPLQVRLPEGAVGMYSLTLLQLPEESVKPAMNVLRWVAAAFRPLTLAEINALGNITYGQGEWDRICKGDRKGISYQRDSTYSDLRRIIVLCDSLLDINADNEVKLVHETAKAFLVDSTSPLMADDRLVNFHVDEATTHGEITQACISYLETSIYTNEWVHLITTDESFEARDKIQANEIALSNFPFLLYASVHWPAHLRQARRGIVKFDSPFFNSRSKLFQNWWSSTWSYIYGRKASYAPSKQSLLHVAAFFDLIEIAEHLSRQSDFLKLMDKNNAEFEPPPLIAVVRGSTQVIELFLNHGAKLSYWGHPYLGMACRRGYTQLARMLLERGESPDSVDTSLLTAKKGLMGVIRHTPEKWLKKYTEQFEDKYDVEGINLARLNYGGNISALQQAASTGQVEAARLLLDRGADVSLATDTGWTAVHFAAYAGQPAMIDLLLEHHAVLDATTVDGRTALHFSAWRGNAAATNSLLEHGLQIDATDKKGDTPLHVAVARGGVSVAQVLVDRGAQRDIQNSGGLTPLQVATAKANAEMIQLLEK